MAFQLTQRIESSAELGALHPPAVDVVFLDVTVRDCGQQRGDRVLCLRQTLGNRGCHDPTVGNTDPAEESDLPRRGSEVKNLTRAQGSQSLGDRFRRGVIHDDHRFTFHRIAR